MQVSPRSRRARGPFIWLTVMIVGGLLCSFAYGFTSNALRGFDVATNGNNAVSDGLTGRINIPLLGIDQRQGMSGPARTDTMLLLTLEPQTHTAGMLSINRDLWVKIPVINLEAKINTAHFYGEAGHLPGGGPALAMQTVQSVFNLPVPYYVRFNFSGFEKMIDLIGGIDVDVPAPIDDPDYPDAAFGYDPFHIDAGWQHMDGRTALKYARTRATPGSDLDRVVRQQQVILAVRDKIVKENLLPQLLPQIGTLLQTLSDSIQTNLSPRQIYQLAEFAGQIEQTQIRAVTIEPSMIEPFQVEGQSALLLKTGVAQQLRDRLFGLIETPAPANQSVVTVPTPETPAPTAAFDSPAATPTTALATPSTYVVQAGDTLFSLARRYGTTVDDLLRANHLASDNIYIGQQLIIP